MLSRILIAALSFSSFTAFAQYDDGTFGNPPLVEAQPGIDVSTVDQFVQPLSQYGAWVSDDGVRAFQPSQQIVGADFTPYASQGQWAATTQGWQFQSSHPFGWATYHYGRWYQSPRYGWVWVADTQWAPSWVEWRYGGGFAGWAPIAPRHIRAQPRWFFVASNDLCNTNVYRYGVRQNRAWGITSSVPVNGGWHRGPEYNDWRSHSRQWRQPQFGQPQFTQPRTHVTVRYDNNGAPPPPPTYSRGPTTHFGSHPAVPPPPPRMGGWTYGGNQGGGNHGGGNSGGGNRGGRR